MTTTKKKILIVDDDSDIRASIKTILQHEGFEIREAVDGQEAWDMLQASVPDLMILDVMMTHDTEGFDLAYQIKEDKELRNIPVIIMTSFLEKVQQAGPETFQHILGEAWPAKWLFEKPVLPRQLIDKIKEILDE